MPCLYLAVLTDRRILPPKIGRSSSDLRRETEQHEDGASKVLLSPGWHPGTRWAWERMIRNAKDSGVPEIPRYCHFLFIAVTFKFSLGRHGLYIGTQDPLTQSSKALHSDRNTKAGDIVIIIPIPDWAYWL